MKNIDRVLKILGSEYSISNIDHENVIYRKLVNGMEIEISGLDNYKKKKLRAFIFIWYNREIIFVTTEINTINQLVFKLNEIIIGYELGVFDECISKI